MKPKARLPAALAAAATLLLCGVPAVAQWDQTNEDGFGAGINSTTAMAVFNEVLYAGTENPGALFRLGNPGGTSLFGWQDVDLPIDEIADVDTIAIPCMCVFSPTDRSWPQLYVAVNGRSGGDGRSFILRSQTGYSWERASEVWDGDTHGDIQAMAVFEGDLYVVFGDTQRLHEEFFRIYRTDATTWDLAASRETIPLGIGDWHFGDLEVFGGYLYAGTSGLNESEDPTRTAEVWRSRNGTDWTKDGDLSSPTMAEVESMEVFAGRLYVGTKNHAEAEDRAGPEIWRREAGEWRNLSAERRSFPREALHVDVLFAYRNALYAATGAAVYTRIYRSIDGETWDQITPEGISGHSEDDNYATGAMAGVGEYVYLGTMLNQEAGTEVWRFATLRTGFGPSLAHLNGDVFLLYEMASADGNVGEAILDGGELTYHGPVRDQDAATTWVLTNKQPASFGYDFMGLLVGSEYVQLVYRSPDENTVWQVRKTLVDGRNWYWQTPELVEGAHTNRAPGATAHNWTGPSGPQLTVAYTDPGSGRIHYRVKQGTNWSSEYSLPSEARSSNGPEIVSFDDDLYVFYRGAGDDDWLYVARKVVNTPSNTEWEISRLTRAFTRASTTDRAVSAVVHDGALVVAYVGHNNDSIWLRRTTDGETWDRLGYVRGPVTENNPDLAVCGGELYLAYKPTGDQELCFGTLAIDTENEHDTAGHIWRTLRPVGCCPGCILIVIPLFSP